MSGAVIQEMVDNCMLARTRIISRVVTGIYDELYQPLGIGSPQAALLTTISRLSPASRAEIGRFTRQDRSTLSRNIKLLLDAGWVAESAVGGRARPLVLTEAGSRLLEELAPLWRIGQARTRALLGETGTSEVLRLGDEIMGAPSAMDGPRAGGGRPAGGAGKTLASPVAGTD